MNERDDPGVLSFIGQHATLIMLVTDRAGKIEQANTFAREWIGQPLIGMDIKDLVVDFSGTFCFQTLLEDSAATHSLTVNTALHGPETLVFLLKRLDQWVLVLGQHDISEIKTLQDQVLSLNSELSNLTRDLHKRNAQLNQLNQLKNQFLGMAAHDLRKPVGVIMSFSELLIQELASRIDEDQAALLGTINQAAQDMARLIDDFLDVSIIESGRLELNLQATPPAEAIEEALRYSQPLAKQRDIDLIVQCAPDCLPIEMDGFKVGQVINNLVANAMEHAPRHTRIWVTCEMDPGEAHFCVRDEGEGISEGLRKSLFEPFERLGPEKTQGERRIGLGLAIAKKIVDAHGGRLRVESGLESGAAFTFTLPVSHQEDGAIHD